MNKNNILYNHLSSEELTRIPITYHFIIPMSKARGYKKIKYSCVLAPFYSAFYLTRFKYIRSNYKTNFLL